MAVDDWLGAKMQALLDCAVARFEADDPTALPGKRFLNPGGVVPFDDCCAESGQLWVRVANVQMATLPWPTTYVADLSLCREKVLAATLGVGIIRCVSTVTEDGEFPSAETMTAEARRMTLDHHLLLDAIACCTPSLGMTSLGQWLPVGAEGGCAGGEWQLTVELPYCPPC